MHLFLKNYLKLEKDGPDFSSPGNVIKGYPRRDWRNGEGVAGYIHYPSTTSVKIKREMLLDWVTNRETLIQEHLLPIQHHRDILMSMPEEQRKVVVMKRDAMGSFGSQMRRSFPGGDCHYRSLGENREKCLEEFKRFREQIDVMFPESDGFLHLEFEDVISNPDKEIKRILDYWGFTYDCNSKFVFPHLK